MTWTWDDTDLSTDLALVRQAVGDTNTNERLLTDEQIASMITLYPDWRVAAAHSCDLIRAKLARDVDRSNQGISATRSQRLQHYLDLKETLLSSATLGATPTGTGFGSIAGKERVTSNSDKVQPAHTRDQWDNDRG